MALLAGPPVLMPFTTTPSLSPPTRACVRSSSRNAPMPMPSQERTNLPSCISRSVISRARFEGIANAMPEFRPRIMVLIPMTSPSQVEQRSAGVAGVDVGVRLQEILVQHAAHQIAATLGADVAEGDRVVEAIGRADRDGKLAHADLRGIAELNRDADPWAGSSTAARPDRTADRCPGLRPRTVGRPGAGRGSCPHPQRHGGS